MSDKRIKYIMKNGKMIHPNLVDGCIGCWDFTLQKNTDNNRTMTPDLSGHGHHMYHNNMLFDEVKLEALQNSTLHSEVVSKNSKGYHVYKYTPKTRASDSTLFYNLVPKKTLKDKQTFSATVYMKYQGNADKLKPAISIYKYPDENGGEMGLSGRVALDETMEQDAEGFYKLSASYTNNTGADITNVALLIYCANSYDSYLEDGHKPVTYFYIDSIDDGVTSLRSGFFSQNSGEGYSRLEYDGIDDYSGTESTIDISDGLSLIIEGFSCKPSPASKYYGWDWLLSNSNDAHGENSGFAINGSSGDPFYLKFNNKNFKLFNKNTSFEKAVIAIENGKGVTVVVDGNKSFKEDLEIQLKNSAVPLRIANQLYQSNSYTKMTIGKLGILNRALTESEIEQIFGGDSIG